MSHDRRASLVPPPPVPADRQEPSWTAACWTGNTGTVVRDVTRTPTAQQVTALHDPYPKGYTARHSSDWGLTKVDET